MAIDPRGIRHQLSMGAPSVTLDRVSVEWEGDLGDKHDPTEYKADVKIMLGDIEVHTFDDVIIPVVHEFLSVGAQTEEFHRAVYAFVGQKISETLSWLIKVRS